MGVTAASNEIRAWRTELLANLESLLARLKILSTTDLLERPFSRFRSFGKCSYSPSNPKQTLHLQHILQSCMYMYVI